MIMKFKVGQTKEWQPKRGDKVLVRDFDSDEWRDRIYLTTIEGAVYPYRTVERKSEAHFLDKEVFDTSCFRQTGCA